MKRSCQVRLIDLSDWIFDTLTGWDDLPIYRLANSTELADNSFENLRRAQLTVSRRRDSGTIEGRTPIEDSALPLTSDLVGTILAAARREDDREYVPDFEDAGDSVLQEKQFVSYRSRVEGGTAVIGPGGKISIFRAATALWVDITVRRRVNAYRSRWREFRSIYRGYQREFAPWRGEVEVQPFIGYFELSKYERQAFLRPAFVFIFSVPTVAENVASWQTVRVEPATVWDEIPLRAGLGQWQSLGGRQ